MKKSHIAWDRKMAAKRASASKQVRLRSQEKVTRPRVWKTRLPAISPLYLPFVFSKFANLLTDEDMEHMKGLP